MHEYDDEVLRTFLVNQDRLFDEPVVETIEEAEAFLEDCMAVVVGSVEDVLAYFEDTGADLGGISPADIDEISEVFPISDGRFLIVEG